jgi:phosphoribosyl-AMP cyclohydrolase / phosphoribosyl-ATP pyrophosphohydrolase
MARVDTTVAEPLEGQLVYDERGLLPCIVQDWHSGEVLMLAYMNEQALVRTRATGELHLWSRSREEPWHKGATSGNTQTVRALRIDCDGDTLLALVEPAGPACHTGERTCFHRGQLEPPAPFDPGWSAPFASVPRSAQRAPTRSRFWTIRR